MRMHRELKGFAKSKPRANYSRFDQRNRSAQIDRCHIDT